MKAGREGGPSRSRSDSRIGKEDLMFSALSPATWAVIATAGLATGGAVLWYLLKT